MKKMKLILVCLLLSFITFGQGKHSVENTTQKLVLKCDISTSYKLAFTTAIENSWNIVSSTPTMYSFSVVTPKTMKRWDDNVNVIVKENKDGTSTIIVKSTLGHKPNIERLFKFIKRSYKALAISCLNEYNSLT